MLVLTFQVGGHRLALDIRKIREVVPRVPLQAVSGGEAGLAGVFIYRGSVVPVVDLFRLTGAGACPPHLSSRIILVPLTIDGRDRLVGLLAAQVADIRELTAPARTPSSLAAPGQPDFGPALADQGSVLHLLDLARLLPEPMLRQLGNVSPEAAA